MQNIWFVKIHRKIRDNPIFWKPNYLAVFMYILLDVEFEWCKKPLRWDLINLNPWEWLFFQKEIADKMWISLGTVSNIIKKLNSENIIEIKTTHKYSIIGLVNWSTYQTQVENTSENQLKTNWKPTETLKEYKEDKEYRYRAFAHLSLSQEEFERLIAEWYTKDQIDDKLDEIENFKNNKKYTSLNLTVRKWIKRDETKNKDSEWIEILKKMQKEWYDPNLMNSYLKLSEKELIKRFINDKEWVNREFKDKKLEIVQKYGIQIDGVELYNLK